MYTRVRTRVTSGSEGVRNARVRGAFHWIAVEHCALEDGPPVHVLRLIEPELNFALRRLRRIGRVHQIAVDGDAQVAADGAGSRFDWISSAADHPAHCNHSRIRENSNNI